MAERPDSEPDASQTANDADSLREHKPAPGDAIDPELVALARPRPRVGVLLAASIVTGCAFLMITLRGDLRFSLAGEPQTLTVEQAAASAATYASVEAHLDRTLVATVAESPGDFGGYRVAPILGSGDRLWIALDRDPWAAPEDYDHIYIGRLEKLDDVAFGDELSAWVAEQPPTPRPVTAQALRDAIKNPGHQIETPSGGALQVTERTPVAITEIVPARARITAFSSSIATEAQWTAALAEAGILAPDDAPTARAEGSWTYEVDAPEGVQAIRDALARAELFGAIAEPLSRTHFGKLGALKASGDRVTVGDAAVAWENIDAVLLLIPRQVPADARILIAGESPADYLLVLPAFLLLAGFLALFGWAFWRAVRRERERAAS